MGWIRQPRSPCNSPEPSSILTVAVSGSFRGLHCVRLLALPSRLPPSAPQSLVGIGGATFPYHPLDQLPGWQPLAGEGDRQRRLGVERLLAELGQGKPGRPTRPSQLVGKRGDGTVSGINRAFRSRHRLVPDARRAPPAMSRNCPLPKAVV